MKTPLLVAALGVSAVFNIYQATRPSPAIDPTKPVPVAPTTAASKTTATPSALTAPDASPSGTAAQSGTAPKLASARAHEIMRLLRSQDVPLSVQVAIGMALASEELLEERKQVTTRAATTVWAAGRSGSERNLTAEQRDRLLKLDLKQDDVMSELLGFDYRRELAKERYLKNPQFAELPLEKLLQLSEMDHERSMVTRDQMRGAGNPVARMGMTEYRNAKSEREEMLAKLFTPDELARYQLYHSDFALQLQRHLEGSEINDQQYAAIYREASKSGGDTNNTTLEPVVAAVRAQVSPEAALKIVGQSDSQFGPSIAVLQRAGLGSDEILRRRELLNQIVRVPGNQRAELYNAATAGLSPEVKTELEKSNYIQGAANRAAAARRRPSN